MKKNNFIKYTILLLLSLIFIFFCIFNICETINRIRECYIGLDQITKEMQNAGTLGDAYLPVLDAYNSAIKSNFKELFFPIVLLCLSIACIVYLVKGSNYLNKAKLTYEEYKELSQKKKAEKQAKNKAKKKEKLENKLKRLE